MTDIEVLIRVLGAIFLVSMAFGLIFPRQAEELFVDPLKSLYERLRGRSHHDR